MKIEKIIEEALVKLGSSKSGNWGHKGRPGEVGGSSTSGGGIVELDLSDFRTRLEHKEKIMGDLSVLKGKFDGATYTDPEGVTFKVRTRVNHWVTGKNVAGTTKQQRYNIEALISAKDRNGAGWQEVIAKTATRTRDTYDLIRSKDVASMSRKLRTMLGIEEKLSL